VGRILGSGGYDAGFAMRIRSWLLIVLAIAFALLPVRAFSGQGYTVLLVNGNSLAANSYSIEGDKIYLKFPIGEAAFRLSEVASIKDDAGHDMLFQEKGVYVPPGPEETSTQPAQEEARPAFTEDAHPVESWHASRAVPGSADPFSTGRGTDVQRKWSPAHYSDQTSEVDSFIDKAFEADEQGTELSDEEYDRAFSSFFEDDSSEDNGADDPDEDW
jgi:hypothetical protein